jgi:hypothetical protein
MPPVLAAPPVAITPPVLAAPPVTITPPVAIRPPVLATPPVAVTPPVTDPAEPPLELLPGGIEPPAEVPCAGELESHPAQTKDVKMRNAPQKRRWFFVCTAIAAVLLGS